LLAPRAGLEPATKRLTVSCSETSYAPAGDTAPDQAYAPKPERAATSLAMPTGNGDQGRHILIAVARYLAVNFPTGRALLQTADIAQRLMRGGELHREVHAAE